MVRKSLALVSRLKVTGPASSPLSIFGDRRPAHLEDIRAAGRIGQKVDQAGRVDAERAAQRQRFPSACQ